MARLPVLRGNSCGQIPEHRRAASRCIAETRHRVLYDARGSFAYAPVMPPRVSDNPTSTMATCRDKISSRGREYVRQRFYPTSLEPTIAEWSALYS